MKKKTKEIKDVGVLEQEIVNKHCAKIEAEIEDAVVELDKAFTKAVSDFEKFAKKQDLNIDKSELKRNGSAIMFQFAFTIDRERFRRKHRKQAVLDYLN